MKLYMSSLLNLDRRAMNKNRNFSLSINKSINRLKQRLQNSPKKRFRKVIPKSSKPSTKPSTKVYSEWSVIWYILTILLILMIVAFILYYFVGNPYYFLTRRYFETPGVSENPASSEGAPISVEEKPDITENPYLTLYGAPDAPGFKRGLGPFMGASGTPDVSGFAGFNEAGYPIPKEQNVSPFNWKRREAKLGDYYLGAELANVPRYQLNEYIQEQNSYVKSVNDRIKQINSERMYSPKYLRSKAELKELREFERRLANKVNREMNNQPYLPDQPYN